MIEEVHSLTPCTLHKLSFAAEWGGWAIALVGVLATLVLLGNHRRLAEHGRGIENTLRSDQYQYSLIWQAVSVLICFGLFSVIGIWMIRSGQETDGLEKFAVYYGWGVIVAGLVLFVFSLLGFGRKIQISSAVISNRFANWAASRFLRDDGTVRKTYDFVILLCAIAGLAWEFLLKVFP